MRAPAVPPPPVASGSPTGTTDGSLNVISPTTVPLFCSLALNWRYLGWPSSKENWKLPLAEGPSLPAKVNDGKTRVITANAATAAKIILFMGGSLFWANLERVIAVWATKVNPQTPRMDFREICGICGQ